MNEQEADFLDGNPIEFKCPYCGKLTSFPDLEAGAPEECPYCSEILVVPQTSTEFGLALPLPIATTRLSLERLQPEDLGGMIDLLSDEGMLRDFEMRPMDETEISDWLAEEPKERFTQQGRPLFLGIHLKETANLIGLVWLAYSRGGQRPVADAQARISVLISPKCQRQGCGSEAVRGLLEFGFRGIHLRRMTVGCEPQNAAAGRALEKAGLRQEGEFLQDRLLNGQWVDTAWYAILASEFN